MAHPVVHIEYPSWVDQVARIGDTYRTDFDRMRVAIDVARRNVAEGTGGPFGAAIFEFRFLSEVHRSSCSKACTR